MALTPNSFVTPQTPKCAVARIQNADASNQKDVITAGANGSKVTALMATSDDTSARIVQLSILRSAVNYPIGTINVPIASGTDGTAAAVNLLDITKIPGLAVDNDGQPYIFLESGDKLQAKTTTTVTSAKTVAIVSTHADF